MFFMLLYKARELQKGREQGEKDNASTDWGISFQLYLVHLYTHKEIHIQTYPHSQTHRQSIKKTSYKMEKIATEIFIHEQQLVQVTSTLNPNMAMSLWAVLLMKECT